MWESLVAICIGLGLAASCGFRVFVPLLMIAVAAKAEMITPAGGFEWLSSWPAVVALSVATCLEIAAYYIPWVDNFLDTVATPAAVVAGIIAAASCVTDVHPLVRWSVAVIAGGGAAGLIKMGTVAVRGASTASTGGLGNPLVATVELVISVILSILSVVLPILAAIIALVLVVWLGRFAWRLYRRLRPASSVAGADSPKDSAPSG